MIDENAKKAAVRALFRCHCRNGHTWREWQYKDIRGRWNFADWSGSTCPECGEQSLDENLERYEGEDERRLCPLDAPGRVGRLDTAARIGSPRERPVPACPEPVDALTMCRGCGDMQPAALGYLCPRCAGKR